MQGEFEHVEDLLDTGFQIMFVTMKENSRLHWHRSMEILYILNGSAVVHMEGVEYCLRPLDFLVIDAARVHEVIYAPPQTMGVCIHISKTFMRKYIPDIELLRFQCFEGIKESKEQSKSADKELDLSRIQLNEQERAEAYLQLSEYLRELTLLYVNQKVSYALESNACVLHILAALVESFSEPLTETLNVTGLQNLSRLEEICSYTEEHYKEAISLKQIADYFAINKEYFCRFFKKNMGTSYMTYLNQVRMSHIYQDLIYTQDGTQEIMERHGFINQKVFYRMFRQMYQCTPRELRSISKDNPYL